MLRFVLGVAGTLVFVGLDALTAKAADIPSALPRYEYSPAQIVSANWSGCFVGGHMSYANASLKDTSTYSYFAPGYVYTSAAPTYSSDSGLAYGGQGGCDFQMPGSNFVFGLGIDGTRYGLTNSRSQVWNYPLENGGVYTIVHTDSYRLDWAATVHGKIGYAFGNFMPYVKAGVAMGGGEHTSIYADSWGASVHKSAYTATGWILGGGVEWRFAHNWSTFLEGRRTTLTNTTPAVRHTVDEVRLGVNYRF